MAGKVSLLVLRMAGVCAVCAAAVVSAPSWADAPRGATSEEEIQSLKQKIRLSERELAMERKRGEALRQRLACNEVQLRKYSACRQRYERDADEYWPCVEQALNASRPCDAGEGRRQGPPESASVLR